MLCPLGSEGLFPTTLSRSWFASQFSCLTGRAIERAGHRASRQCPRCSVALFRLCWRRRPLDRSHAAPDRVQITCVRRIYAVSHSYAWACAAWRVPCVPRRVPQLQADYSSVCCGEFLVELSQSRGAESFEMVPQFIAKCEVNVDLAWVVHLLYDFLYLQRQRRTHPTPTARSPLP